MGIHGYAYLVSEPRPHRSHGIATAIRCATPHDEDGTTGCLCTRLCHR